MHYTWPAANALRPQSFSVMVIINPIFMEKPSVHLLGLGCPALKIRLVEAHIHATKLQSLKMCKIVSGGGLPYRESS